MLVPVCIHLGKLQQLQYQLVKLTNTKVVNFPFLHSQQPLTQEVINRLIIFPFKILHILREICSTFILLRRIKKVPEYAYSVYRYKYYSSLIAISPLMSSIDNGLFFPFVDIYIKFLFIYLNQYKRDFKNFTTCRKNNFIIISKTNINKELSVNMLKVFSLIQTTTALVVKKINSRIKKLTKGISKRIQNHPFVSTEIAKHQPCHFYGNAHPPQRRRINPLTSI